LNYLLKKGVDEGKVIVLIVDEGQNLPEQIIDVFRTLLNFETDEYKLLQLIIFGQPEMTKMLSNYPNFEDRIAFNFELGPVSLEDTRGLIDYRIKISGEENQAWFSDGAIKEIHKVTDGFPRKMTQLCHQLLLAMIGEERESIDAKMVKRIVSGEAPNAENLKKISSSGEFDDIAVNKLLDVLRNKDKAKKVKPSDPDPITEKDEKEDVIENDSADSVEEKVEINEENTDDSSEKDVDDSEINLDEDDEWIGEVSQDLDDEIISEEEISEPSLEHISAKEDADSDPSIPNVQDSSAVPQEPLPSPGEYDHGFDTIHTFFDPASIEYM